MKVLRAITWLPPGGIERRLVAILPRLRDRHGIQPEVVCLRERGPLADDLERAGIPVHVVPFRRRWDLAALGQLARLIRSGSFELVHAHMYRAYIPCTVAAWRAGVPMLGQVHNVDTWQGWRQRAMDRLLVPARAGMIAVSGRVADDVRASLHLPAERVHVLYNGIDLTQFQPPDPEARDATRAALGLPPGAIAALCPARLHPQKNHAGLLAAWGQAMSSLPPERRQRAVLLLAGDGGERAKLEALAAPMGDAVRFLGHRDDMATLYGAADLMVLPSFKEGFSNAVLEAMACGLPPVVTDVGGNAEALADGREGIVVADPNDTAALATALARLLGDDALRATMSRASVERVQAFSLDAMATNTAALYRQVLAG